MTGRLSIALLAIAATVVVAWIGAADWPNMCAAGPSRISMARVNAWIAQRHERPVSASEQAEFRTLGWTPRPVTRRDMVSEVAALERISFARREIVWYERARYTGNGLICGNGWPDDLLLAQRLEAGWPFRCLYATRSELEQESHGALCPDWLPTVPDALEFRPVAPLLPYRPLWLGFGANTFIYFAAANLLLLGPRTLVRARRRSRGLCPTCAYPIGLSRVCTECGRAVQEARRGA